MKKNVTKELNEQQNDLLQQFDQMNDSSKGALIDFLKALNTKEDVSPVEEPVALAEFNKAAKNIARSHGRLPFTR